jgi:anaerobic ribonucleoside-triphosphate reductase
VFPLFPSQTIFLRHNNNKKKGKENERILFLLGTKGARGER